MEKARFAYVTYICTAPGKVWNALLDSEVVRQYWGRHQNVSDWKPGSSWAHQDYDDPAKVDIVGKVVENSPPRRLVLTWALPADAADESTHSRVTIELEPFNDTTRMTVIHDQLEPGSAMLHGITQGWPLVLSSLKTLLETGMPMPMMSRRWEGPPE